MARQLTQFLFDDINNLVRIDMSEYMEKFSISRLVGAPPGYVGYDEGGLLTEKVRRNPYSVILLDEIEKAHPDVFNLLLQVLEDGVLTDSFGRNVDFKNTILIMTSNVGSRKGVESKAMGFEADDEKQKASRLRSYIQEDMRKTFSPEFLNRIDDVILFDALDRDAHAPDPRHHVAGHEHAAGQPPGDLRVHQDAKDRLVEVGFDPEHGARPLRRAIQRYVEDPLSDKLLRGEIRSGGYLRIDVAGDRLGFEVLDEGRDPSESASESSTPSQN